MSPIFTLLCSDATEAAKVAAGLCAADWQMVDRQASQHRLRPLLHRRAVEGGWDIPEDCARRWQARYQRSARRALDQKAALTRIGRALQRGGVTAAVLKGGTFVWSGAIDPAVRPMRDLDLLVRPEDAARASALLHEIGFIANPHARPSGKHLPGMSDGKTVVELHLHLFDTHTAAAAAREAGFAERAWARKRASVVPGIDGLCPTDTLLHLILHAVLDHQFNNGPLLLIDMPVLVEAGEIDWALLWREAEQIGAIRACQLALALGQSLCGLPVEWHGHEPVDLAAGELDMARRLMLVDMENRAAVGWPGHLLRLPPHRWPGQLRAMVRRRGAGGKAAGSEERGPSDEPDLGTALAYALRGEGRARIADAVRLSLWLRR
jgi:hypothetical protein